MSVIVKVRMRSRVPQWERRGEAGSVKGAARGTGTDRKVFTKRNSLGWPGLPVTTGLRIGLSVASIQERGGRRGSFNGVPVQGFSWV